MRVRELLPFIDDQQEMVIRASEGGKSLGGTARDIRHNTNKKEVKVYKEIKFECELMKSYLE